MERRSFAGVVLLRLVHEHLDRCSDVFRLVAIADSRIHPGRVVWRDYCCGGADMAAKEPFATILTVLIAIRKAGGG